MSIIVALLLLRVIGSIVNLASGTSSSARSPAAHSSYVGVGSEGRLFIRGNGALSVGVTEEAFNEMNTAISVSDSVGYRTILLAGRAFIVQEGTRVLVIERGLFRAKVRILDGTQKDRAGWVASEWVKP
jgi:hypothetical protein